VLLWVNTRQQVSVSSNRGRLAKPVDVSDRDYIKKSVAEPWAVQIGRPVQGRVSEKWVLPVSMGLTDFDGTYLGTIVVSLDVNTLTSGIQKDMHHKGVGFSILSKTLTPITEMSGEEGFPVQMLSGEALARVDLARHPSGVLARPALFSRSSGYVRYEVSSRYPYVILIGYDGALNARELSQHLLPRLAIVFVDAVLLLLLIWMIRHRVIRPVSALSGRVEQMVRGEAFRPLTGIVPTEIERLEGQIGTLAQLIAERRRTTEELLVKNAYLRRIKETAQLMGRARREFLVTLAGELEKPTAALALLAEELCSTDGAERDRLAQCAFSARYTGTELGCVARDLRRVSTMEQDGLILYEKPTSVLFCVHRAVRMFQEHPSYRAIEVKLRLDDALPKMVMDEDVFVRIVLNVLFRGARMLASGNAMVLEAKVYRIPGKPEEMLLMLKFPQRQEEDAHLEIGQMRRLKTLAEEERTASQMQAVSSEAINLALTRMLVSLHQGVMETELSANRICRINIRFPESRIHRKRKA
jgi:signal transduction histidine kinase